jgi:hypothetical protein
MDKMELLNIIALMFSSSAASQGIDWLSDSPPRPRFDGAHRGLQPRADHVPARRLIDSRLSTAARPVCQSVPQIRNS